MLMNESFIAVGLNVTMVALKLIQLAGGLGAVADAASTAAAASWR